ncbi:MAG: hypothetical protein K2Y22_11905 [Candidatus Obscuribacterales bacterium]|nr:hypothetical protein [Candidatus Obscuribacterales bacterium]
MNSSNRFLALLFCASTLSISANAQEQFSQAQSNLSADYSSTNVSTPVSINVPTRVVDQQVLTAVQPGIPPVISESEQGLTEIRDTIGKIKHVLSQITHEVQRIQVYDMPTPVDMDETFMDPTLQSDYFYPMQPVSMEGMRTGQPLPARKKWMDYYSNQLTQLMPLLKNDAAALVLPEQGGTPISAQMDVMKDSCKQIQTDYGQLQTAMAGPNYDNQYIARLAGALRDDLCGVDSVRKHMLRIVQNDRKQSAKTF